MDRITPCPACQGTGQAYTYYREADWQARLHQHQPEEPEKDDIVAWLSGQEKPPGPPVDIADGVAIVGPEPCDVCQGAKYSLLLGIEPDQSTL